jgi:hypothetical protein
MLIATGDSHPCFASCHFEFRIAKPRHMFYPKEINKYNPLLAASSFPERLIKARRALGLSQRKMAEKSW